MSVRLRLTLWYSGLLAVLLAAFGFSVYEIVYHNTMDGLKKRLVQEAQRMAVSGFVWNNRLELELTLPSGFDGNKIIAQLVNYHADARGMVSSKTLNMLQGGLEMPYPSRPDAVERFVRFESDSGLSFLVLEVPKRNGGELLALLQVGILSESEDQLLAQLRTILWLIGAAGLVAAFCLGLFLARKALLPIGRVTAAAEQIQYGSHLGMRIPREKANDEIGRLTDTLNGMLARLERAYNELEESNAAQRRFVSDASHELRTPLTTIRGNIDLLEKVWTSPPAPERETLSLEAIRDIADEARRMSRLVNDLLSLARADSGFVMDKENVALLPIAEEAARRAAFLPRRAEWRVGSLSALEGAWVYGNRDYLLQLLFIFIENGFKYTPEGEVRMDALREEGLVGIRISDTGIGMGEEEVPHIFDRFYRADESRGVTSGTGLGLSIAKWILDMHDGMLDVKTKPGKGSAFTVWLPARFAEDDGCAIMESTERPALPAHHEEEAEGGKAGETDGSRQNFS